jgi:hypothetical protein
VRIVLSSTIGLSKTELRRRKFWIRKAGKCLRALQYKDKFRAIQESDLKEGKDNG